MARPMNNREAPTAPASEPSSFLVVSVVTKYQSGGEEKRRWSRVGAAFPNKLGGYNVKLDFPVGTSELTLAPPYDGAKDGK